MIKANFPVLLLLSYGVLQSLAITTPPIQLEMGADPSGCVNITSCSYGCGKLSSSSDKHVLTPVCPPAEVLPIFPQRITIRGKANKPRIYDEDQGTKYNCHEMEPESKQYLCIHNDKKKKKKKSKKLQVSASASASASAYSSIYDGVQFIKSLSEASPTISPKAFAITSPSVFAGAQINSHITISAHASTKTSTSPVPSASAAVVVNKVFKVDAVNKASSSAVVKSQSAAATVKPIANSRAPNPSLTKSVAAAAASEEPYYCEFIPSIVGEGNGLGNLGDCCVNSDDCHGSCIEGACNGEHNIPTGSLSVELPSPSTSCIKNSAIFGRRQGQGNLGDCCLNSNDCHGACIEGVCNGENNAPRPVCSNISFKGRRNGKGPKGACCNTQADCQESCVSGVCTAPLNY